MSERIAQARVKMDHQEDRASSVPKGSSGVRRLDPRVSLFVLVLMNIQMAFSSSIWFELTLVGLSVICYIYCGRFVPLCRWGGFYVAFALIGYVLMLSGNSFLSPFAASFLVYRHVLPLFMFAANMIATTRAGELACALQRLRLPSRLIVALVVAIRFFPTIGREFKAVSEAMKTRGIGLSVASVVGHPIRTVERLLVPVIARLGTVADELGNAVVVRGVETDRKRSSYYSLKLGAFDGVVAGLAIVFFACAVAFKVGAFPWM